MTSGTICPTITGMGVITSQQIGRFYELFKNIDVTFSKEIISLTGLQINQVFLKCIGDQWPCVLYTSSFSGAKLIITKSPVLMEKIAKAKNNVSVRLAFQLSGTKSGNNFKSFFIAGKVTGFGPYAQKENELQIVSIQYSQQPPDDYIEIIGSILDANVNAARRKDERILLSVDVIRMIKLVRKETVVQINAAPLKCIVRDLSFSGAKVIVIGDATNFMHAPAVLYLDFDDPREMLAMTGSVIRYEAVEDRPNMVALGIHFDESKIPISYKMHINLYMASNLAPLKKTAVPEKSVAEAKAKPEEKAEEEGTADEPDAEHDLT